jgi:hypothetical protein
MRSDRYQFYSREKGESEKFINRTIACVPGKTPMVEIEHAKDFGVTVVFFQGTLDEIIL